MGPFGYMGDGIANVADPSACFLVGTPMGPWVPQPRLTLTTSARPGPAPPAPPSASPAIGEGDEVVATRVGWGMPRAPNRGPDDRMAAFVRLAKRLKKAKRESPTMEDYRVVSGEHGVSNGTLRSWMSRWPEEWARAVALVGGEEVVATRSTDLRLVVESGEKEGEVIPFGLTPQQAQACRLRTCEGLTQIAISRVVGVTDNTICLWEKLPAWVAYRDELSKEMHLSTLAAHKAAATMGARLRIQVMGEIAKILDAERQPGELLSPATIKDIGNTLDRLTASSEDRAGYPKTERIEHSHREADPLEALPDDALEAEEEAALRLVYDAEAQ